MFVRNPYKNRGALTSNEDFFGRSNQLHEVFSRILFGQSITLIGERRVGKSSLLNALDFPEKRQQFLIPEDVSFAYLNMQYVSEAEEQRVLEHFVSQIADAIDAEPRAPNRDALFALAKQGAAQGRRLVVVIDEFDVLLHNQKIPLHFFSFLRAWSGEFQIAFAVASREGAIPTMVETVETGSSFLNIFTPIYIGPMSPAEADELIRTPARRQGVEFLDQEVEWVLDLAGYHPYLLQVACDTLFKLRVSDTPPDDIGRELKSGFLFQVEQQLDYLWERLAASEQRDLRRWFEERPPFENLATYRDLKRKGIVIQRHGEMAIFSEAFLRNMSHRTEPAAAKGPGWLRGHLRSLLE